MRNWPAARCLPPVMLELLRSLVLLLAPFAPHLVAELWEELGEQRLRSARAVAAERP